MGYSKLTDQGTIVPGDSVPPEPQTPQQMYVRKKEWLDGGIKDKEDEWLGRAPAKNILHWLEEQCEPERRFGDQRLKIYHFG